MKKQHPEHTKKSVLISTHPQARLVNTLNPSVVASIEEVSSNSELIFDASILSFKAIINHMQDPKVKTSIFKIQPKNCHYILGSNSADSVGEVIQF
jgi:hypothetical protein